MNSIPSLDLSEFLSDDPSRKNQFVNQLGNSFEEIGFISLKNHFLKYQTHSLNTLLYYSRNC